MKKHRFLRILALVFALTAPCAMPAQADLLAPAYPGSVPADKELSQGALAYQRAFFARQPIQEVLAFYERATGPLEEIRAGREYRSVVRRPPRFKASAEPELIGVYIFSRVPADREGDLSAIPPEALQTLPDRCRSGHFDNLRRMVAQLDQYGWKDFAEVCHRFEHVDWAYFEITEQTDERGRALRLDQVLLEEQKKSLGLGDPAGMGFEAMGQRIQDLMMQGRFQEATELTRQMQDQSLRSLGMDSGGAIDQWDEWVRYLERLDSHAYRTMIMIHRDPSSWPEKPF